jgi:hypothetical protein
VEFVSSFDPKHPTRSSTKHHTVNPEWNETFQFFIYDKSTDTINMSVYDADITNKMNTFLGAAVLHMDTVKRNTNKPQEITLSLRDVETGSIRLLATYRSIKRQKPNFTKTTEEMDIDDHIVYNHLDEEDLVTNDKLMDGFRSSLSSDDSLDGEMDYEGEGNDKFDLTNSLSFSPRGKVSCVGTGRPSIDEGRSVYSNLTNSSNNSKPKRFNRNKPAPALQKIEEFNKSVESMIGILNISQIKLTNIKLNDGSIFMESTLRLYVNITLGHQKMETKYIKNNHNPTFIENFTFIINSFTEELVVKVYNKAKYSITSSKPLGSVVIPLKDLIQKNADDDVADADDFNNMRNPMKSGIQKVEQQYMLNGLKEEGFVGFKAVLSMFEN